MKKVYLLVISAISSVALFAQAPMLTPTVIASTGGYSSSSSGGFSLSYTVGEMTMVQTFSANGNILTQGFQQPNDLINGLIDVTQDEFGSFTVYPNPAVDNFYYGFQLPEQGKVDILLFDELGQKVSDIYHSNYQSGKIVAQVNSANFAAGMYFLTMNFTSSVDGKSHITTKKVQVVR